MLTDTATVFPMNALNVIYDRFLLLEASGVPAEERVAVFRRSLRSSDPIQSIGVFPTLLTPDDQSYEMRNSRRGLHQPTIQQYDFTIQGMVVDMDEERGLATHSVMASLIRSILSHDEPLRVGWAALSVNVSTSKERTQRWGVRRQRFLSNEIDGSWIFLSTTEAFLETETT